MSAEPFSTARRDRSMRGTRAVVSSQQLMRPPLLSLLLALREAPGHRLRRAGAGDRTRRGLFRFGCAAWGFADRPGRRLIFGGGLLELCGEVGAEWGAGWSGERE